MKIVFVGTQLYRNLGGPSLLVSTCKVLRTYIPDAEFALLSPCPDEDSMIARAYGVEIIGYRLREVYMSFLLCVVWSLLRKIGIEARFLLKNRIAEKFSHATVVIDITGISFTDYFPSVRGYIWQSARLLIGILLDKPVAKFTQDMGPFNNRINKYLARYVLNRLDFILARSQVTKRYVEELGVTRPVFVHPDTSFVLDPAPREQIAAIMLVEKLDRRPLVGIVVSRQIDRRASLVEKLDKVSQNSYSIIMARLADYLIEEKDALVVFIPNEIALPEAAGYDDLFVARKVCEIVNNKGMVRLLTKEYNAQELKGLLKECDLVISSRYHSAIAALSTGTPCLVVGWGFKYTEPMELVGQDEYVFNFVGITFEEVREKVEALWHEREKIKEELNARIPGIRESVLSGGKLVKDIIDSIGR
ncbi:MAG: polysaccharide pyruvyl transferase family protein [Thermodesulfobacteriota bacterium]